MARNGKQKQQPFHKAILVVINRARTKVNLGVYAKLIVATKIPAGHSEIMEALRQKAIALNAREMPVLGVAISLLRTQEIEESEKGKRNPRKLLFPGPFMEKGSKGPAVVVLQIVLKMFGCGWEIEVDGDFGDKTEEGLCMYQRTRGLEVDGKCGPEVRAEICRQIGIDFDSLPADLFRGETVTVPLDTWA